LSQPKAHIKAELGWPTGDQPGELRFQYAPSEAARHAILHALSPVFPPAKSPDATLLALTPPEGVTGRYRLTTPDGNWFVRVSMWWSNPIWEQNFTDYLASRNVPVNRPLIAGIVLEWEGHTYRIDIRPLIAGRHFKGSLDDLAQTASTLAACHTALRDFPFRSRVRYTAKLHYVSHYRSVQWKMKKELSDMYYEMFGDQSDWAREHLYWLREMVRDFMPLFHKLPGAQCVHGQVHPGNVIFQSSDGRAVLVDWEEAVHNYAPPAFDLAYFVQRFCLRDDPAPDILRQRLDTITAHYGELPPLADMMRQLAWMSIAAIVDYQRQGIVTPASEYDKFVRLEWQARALIGVL
jgi:Ser/Thr protein kinase RdoA (MazF antagonist)